MSREKQLLALFLAVLVVGCGKGDYDQLVKARIDQLNRPAGGPFQTYNAQQFGFVVDFPGVPTGGPAGADSEQVESVVDGVRYNLNATRSNAVVAVDSALQAVVDTYAQQGYQETSRDNVDVDGQPCKRAELTHGTDGLLVRLQACVVDLDAYIMIASGAELNDEIVDRFFDSFVP